MFRMIANVMFGCVLAILLCCFIIFYVDFLYHLIRIGFENNCIRAII